MQNVSTLVSKYHFTTTRRFFPLKFYLFKNRCAYVIPAFEIDERSYFPQSKKDIIGMYKNGSARQFHVELYRYGHLATDYNKYVFF